MGEDGEAEGGRRGGPALPPMKPKERATRVANSLAKPMPISVVGARVRLFTPAKRYLTKSVPSPAQRSRRTPKDAEGIRRDAKGSEGISGARA